MVSLTRLQARTEKAAGDAYATGQITLNAYRNMTDGKVSKSDLAQTERLWDKADTRHESVNRMGSGAQIRLAERRVEIAERLFSAVEEQYDKQNEVPVTRPRTGGGKGNPRPRRRVSRPSVK